MKRLVSNGKAASLRTRATARAQSAPHAKSSSRRGIKPNAVIARELDREEQWRLDIITLRRAAEDLAQRRVTAQGNAVRTTLDSFSRVATSLDDSSAENRGAVVRDLYNMDPERAASFFNIALRDGSPEERRQIGAGLEASGLVEEAIRDLMSDSHQHSYRAFSLLFLVAKAGTIQPIMRLIESHPSIELRLALIRLLTSSREPELVFQFQRLISSGSIPPELCIAMKEAIAQIG